MLACGAESSDLEPPKSIQTQKSSLHVLTHTFLGFSCGTKNRFMKLPFDRGRQHYLFPLTINEKILCPTAGNWVRQMELEPAGKTSGSYSRNRPYVFFSFYKIVLQLKIYSEGLLKSELEHLG